MKENKPSGCIWIVVTAVLTGLLYSFLSIFTNFTTIVVIIIAFITAILITNLLVGKPNLKSLLGFGISLIVLLFGIRFLALLIVGFFNVDNNTVFSEDENVKTEYIMAENDTVPIYKSHRIWKDSYGQNFETDLIIRQADFKKLQYGNAHFAPQYRGNFWGQLYDYMDNTNVTSLDILLENFSKINSELNLDQMQFADMVVSCIQDIPYSYVLQESCEEAIINENSIRNLLNRCPDCCLGNILYGVQNPTSFIQNLKGDCDTRTVIIYSILKHFNYDVAILNSDFYLHSVIGLNLPSTGLNKLYNGKKYVVWETTSKNYPIGQLSSTMDEMQNWNVVITSK